MGNDIAVPHTSHLPHGVKVGSHVIIKGWVPVRAYRFTINLGPHSNSDKDVAFQFQPRFDQGTVIMNSKKGGKWGKEEVSHHLPWVFGGNFEIHIKVGLKGFEVSCDGIHFADFAHRSCCSSIHYLHVSGDCHLKDIQFCDDEKIAVPYSAPLPEEFNSKSTLVIGGRCAAKAKLFHVSLTKGDNVEEDVVLCMKVDMEEKEVAFNSHNGEEWTTPVVYGGDFPFVAGGSFELSLRPNLAGYMVSLNGAVLSQFDTSAKYAASKLHVSGDVELKMIQNQVDNVRSVPFSNYILGGLSTGSLIVIDGKVPIKCSRFSVNLCEDSTFAWNCGLHFNPRFDQKKVVLTSRSGGNWQKEEFASLPFDYDKNFQIQIRVTDHGFKVSVDNNFLCDFSHRQAVESLRFLYVVGDVLLGKVQYLKEEHVAIPYSEPLAKELEVGSVVKVSGRVPGKAKEFSVYLSQEAKYDKQAAFHFNPNFETKMVEMSWLKDGKWSQVESGQGFPFCHNSDFEIILKVARHGYQLMVNGEHFYTFSHRVASSGVGFLNIVGDVQVYNLFFPDPDPISIPHSSIIPQGLAVGSGVSVSGYVPANAHSFSINFCPEKTFVPDCAFHLSPRFDSNVLAMNSMQNARWQKEEVADVQPFTRGKAFELHFSVSEKSYTVLVNGHKVCEFDHRHGLSDVRHLYICGDVVINNIQHAREAKISSPYSGHMPDGLAEGAVIVVKGSVPLTAERFSINLCPEPTFDPNCALHVNARFDMQDCVLNSRSHGNWESSETAKDLVFAHGADFEMSIKAEASSYKIQLNGKDYAEFKHRQPISSVNYIYIVGDVNISSLDYPGLPELAENIAFSSYIPEGICVGDSINIMGRVSSHPEQFCINLCSGPAGDVALHFNPRFDLGRLLLNHKQKGQWGVEEDCWKMPFHHDQDFRLTLKVVIGGYELFFNGRYFCFFDHRIPVETVRYMYVTGDVKVCGAAIQNYASFGVPISGHLPEGLCEGTDIVIQGKVSDRADTFVIKLNGGPGDKDSAMSLKANFRSDKVTINNKAAGAWLVSEIHENKFVEDQEFVLVLKVSLVGYQIWLNNEFFAEFQHRGSLENVKYLHFIGDVQVHDIQFEKNVVVPYSRFLPTALAVGSEINVTGWVPADCQRFSVNLCADATYDHPGMTALHISPGFDKESIYLANRQDGKWKDEVNIEGLKDFKHEAAFDLLIKVEAKGYKILLNGKDLGFYDHKQKFEEVKWVYIHPDVFINSISSDWWPKREYVVVKKSSSSSSYSSSSYSSSVKMSSSSSSSVVITESSSSSSSSTVVVPKMAKGEETK